MFTVAALFFTALGIPLVAHGGPRVLTRVSKTGCYCLLIAAILWCVVFIALIHRAIGWLLGHAP